MVSPGRYWIMRVGVNSTKIVDERRRCNAQLTDLVFDVVPLRNVAQYKVRFAPLS
jgi:hypothetical protein